MIRLRAYIKIVGKVFLIFSLFFILACSKKPVYKIDYYEPAYRQSPPEPVYSRLMWSHLPQPIKPRTQANAPLLMPEIFVELKDVTPIEAIEAVSQTMGYRWELKGKVPTRKISIHMEGTIEEVIKVISQKAGIKLALDHERRIVKLADQSISPKLPRSKY